MKNYLTIFLLITFYPLFAQIPIGKNTVDEIKVYTNRKEPYTFYEGQLISFDYFIENTSNKIKNYHKDILPYVIKVREESGKEIKWRNPYPNIDYLNQEEDFSSVLIDQMPPKYKIKRSSVVSPWLWGNTNIKELLNIPDSLYRSYRFKPLFFKPGKYEAEIECRLIPVSSSVRLRLNVKFEVLQAEKKIKEEFMEFLNVYSKLIYSDDVVRTEEQQGFLRDFFNIIKENPTNHYASLIFYILAFEPELYNQIRFQSDNNYIYQMFQLAPEIKPEIPFSDFNYFYEENVHRIDEFRNSGLINDEKQYLIEYLKKIKDLDPIYSETIIREAKKYLNIEGLENYAKINK